jgi:hypothetical protein
MLRINGDVATALCAVLNRPQAGCYNCSNSDNNGRFKCRRADFFDRAPLPKARRTAQSAILTNNTGRLGDPSLLKRDLAHGFRAKDFADIEALYRGGAALVFGAHRFLDDGVHLVAQSIKRGHVRILHHD